MVYSHLSAASPQARVNSRFDGSEQDLAFVDIPNALDQWSKILGINIGQAGLL